MERRQQSRSRAVAATRKSTTTATARVRTAARAAVKKAVKKATPAKTRATVPVRAKAKAAAPVKKATPAKTRAAAPVRAKARAAAPVKKTLAPKPKVAPAPAAPPVAKRVRKPVLDKFLLEQRELLRAELDQYVRQAEELKADADQLAAEMEPGESEFGEEGGEGGNLSVERELDLRLSAQARTAAAEIERALAKIEAGTYGLCEKCGQPIPRLRLKALPAAPLCVACKSGGLSRR